MAEEEFRQTTEMLYYYITCVTSERSLGASVQTLLQLLAVFAPNLQNAGQAKARRTPFFCATLRAQCTHFVRY